MADTLGTHNPLRYRGYVYDAETGLYYLQSRYYDPGMGRFINGDAFASTGQGLLGNNMFAYCGNNPINFNDYLGYRMEQIHTDTYSGALGFSTAGFDPNRDFSTAKSTIRIPDLSNFFLIQEKTMVPNGVKVASILTGGLTGYSISDEGLSLVSFDLSGVALDIENENYSLSFFNIGNISMSMGIKGLPYAGLMVSLWSPSVSANVFSRTITLSVHVGALGAEAKLGRTGGKFGFAKGIGFSVAIE